MKIEYECPVESKTRLEEAVAVFGGKVYKFSPNKDGYLNKITIVVQAEKPALFKTGFSQLEGHKKDSLIYFHEDVELKHQIIEELRYLEGMLVFTGNVTRVDWTHVWTKIIAETPDEKKQIKLDKFTHKPVIRDDEKSLGDDDVANILMRGFSHEFLSPYLSFFREGKNEFKQRRFIGAFYNFYFILEAIYGNDKWRNDEIMSEFEKSRDLLKFIREAIRDWKVSEKEAYSELAKMVKELRDRKGNPVKKRMGARGVIHAIVNTRGALHHFSSEESRQLGSHFNHEKFLAVSMLLHRVCHETISKLNQKNQSE